MSLYKVEKTDEVHVLGNYIYFLYIRIYYIYRMCLWPVFLTNHLNDILFQSIAIKSFSAEYSEHVQLVNTLVYSFLYLSPTRLVICPRICCLSASVNIVFSLSMT